MGLTEEDLDIMVLNEPTPTVRWLAEEIRYLWALLDVVEEENEDLRYELGIEDDEPTVFS